VRRRRLLPRGAHTESDAAPDTETYAHPDDAAPDACTDTTPDARADARDLRRRRGIDYVLGHYVI
jgi:hypothetical protein